MKLRNAIVPACAAILLTLVAVTPMRPYADTVMLSGYYYEYKWGSPPNVQFTGRQELSKDDSLAPGDYWEAVYTIKVHVHICFGDDPNKIVKGILTQYLKNMLGQLKYKYPYIYLFYADFKEVRDEDDPNDPFGWWAIYKVVIIGQVMQPPTTNGESRKLAWWVGVAVILALILGCIIAGKMAIDDPHVYKLLKGAYSAVSSAASAAANAVASAGPALWVMVAGFGLLLIAFALAMIVATLRKPVKAAEAVAG